MKKLTLALLALLAAACGEPAPPYSNSELQLLTGFYAKMTCSCRFVMEQSPEACRNWVRQSPEITVVSVNVDERTVDARIAEVWHQRARYRDARHGCVLE